MVLPGRAGTSLSEYVVLRAMQAEINSIRKTLNALPVSGLSGRLPAQAFNLSHGQCLTAS